MSIENSIVALLRRYTFRGKWQMLNRLVPQHGERIADVFGYSMRLDLEDYIQRSIYLGAFEAEETRLVRNVLRPGMTAVDVGANVGYFTLLAASRVGASGRVFAVEPSPYAFGRLRESVERNGISFVHAVQAGLSDEPGEMELFVSRRELRNHSPTFVPNAGGDPVRVRVQTLDALLDEEGVENVDLLKVDVEGFEPFVFRGGRRSLASGRIRAILCEFNDHWLGRVGSSPRDLSRELLDFGFVDTGAHAEFEPGCTVNRLLVWQG